MENMTPLARHLSDTGDAITSITASGSRGTVRIPVTAAQSDGVTAAYRLPILQTEATPDKIDYIIEHGLQYAEEIVPQYQLQAPSDK